MAWHSEANCVAQPSHIARIAICKGTITSRTATFNTQNAVGGSAYNCIASCV